MSKTKTNTSLMLGLMSGTSLDGLDLALCEFIPLKKRYNFKIIKTATVKYPTTLKRQLLDLMQANAQHYLAFDARYGEYLADKVKVFLNDVAQKPLAIASHGHTVFHQPQIGFSAQVGNGAVLATKTGITTVCDFRNMDVANGGQGAPLVPIGDELLFGNYDACLNIGGIANMSFNKNGKRRAYDICVANMLLNHLAGTLNKPYDKGGQLAAKGTSNATLTKQLNGLDYYKKRGAKSLGREWFEKEVIGLFEKSNLSTYNQLATATEHIALKIALELNTNKIKHVLITGGGAFNTHLIERIKNNTACKLILPPAEIINFKEALIFAFLGYLRLNHKINTLSSVTGAKINSSGGAVYLGS